jgi:uncharacterized membrane protein YphA (DoxX/SURF4 family)
MLELVLRLALGATLVGAGVLKALAPAGARASLDTFGVRGRRAQLAAWWGLVAIEVGLGAGVLAGLDAAAIAAAALMLGFAAALLAALARGRAGARCPCFGARSRVRPAAVARDLLLAGGFAALPFLPAASPSPEAWLALGLGVSLAACAGLAVGLAALAREVGALRLAVAPQAALELEHEGPELGSRSDLVDGMAIRPGARLALAIFTSEGCAACHALEPALDYVARDPVLAVRRFDEHRDAGAWRALDVPGSPFAVALGLDGTVLAKGSFNTLGQLESVLATAERRQRETADA